MGKKKEKMESQITWGGIGEEEEEAIVLVHQTKPGDVEAVSPVIIVDLSHNRSREREIHNDDEERRRNLKRSKPAVSY